MIVKMLGTASIGKVEYTAGRVYEIDKKTYKIISQTCVKMNDDYKHKMKNEYENKMMTTKGKKK